MRNEIVTAAKARRRVLAKELKMIDSVIGKLSGGRKTKRRKAGTRKASKAAKRPKPPKTNADKKPKPAAAPKPTAVDKELQEKRDRAAKLREGREREAAS